MLIHGPGPGQAVTAPLSSPEVGFSAQITVKKWFTTVRAVKNLFFRATGGTDVQNEEVILLGNSAARLRLANVKVDSERVKKLNVILPPDAITFSDGNTWVNLTNDDVVRESVQVFDEGEDERLLIKGTDYEIDYKIGRIKRIQAAGTPGSAKGTGSGSGSSIAQCAAKITIQQKVVVHYSYYTDYSKDVDYHINYQNGRISRLYDSSIEIGERVYIDYETETNIDNVIVETAIDQAHTFIMQRISLSLEGSTSMGLQYAETYFALAYIALASASDMLESRRNDEVEDAAHEMVQVATHYEEKGWEFLSQFLTVTAPRSTAAVSLKNRSWRNW